MQYVAVVSSTGTPLMPCHPARARQLVRDGKAVRRFKAGLFYIRLTERADGDLQPVAAGIDPGSKREGYTVASAKRVFLNILADAVTHVGKAVADRRDARRARRFRKTPCRANRQNRARGGIPPSTKARWGAKVRLTKVLKVLYPLAVLGIEDVKARTQEGMRRWNASFSPLEVGKRWCYGELGKLAPLHVQQGYATAAQRDSAGLTKTGNKMSETFEAHCVDSFVIARAALASATGVPDNIALVRMSPVRLHRRELHRRQPGKSGIRSPYGGTQSHGFKRGALVRHPQWGVTMVGGFLKDRISLHDRGSGGRLTQTAKPRNCTPIAFNAWRTRWAPTNERSGDSSPTKP